MQILRALVIVAAAAGMSGCAMVDLVAHATKEFQRRSDGGAPAEVRGGPADSSAMSSMAANEPSPPPPTAAPAPAVSRAAISAEPLAPPSAR